MAREGEKETTIALLAIDSIALALLLYAFFSTLSVLLATFGAFNGMNDPWAVIFLFWLFILAAIAQAYLWAILFFELLLIAGCVIVWMRLYRKLKRMGAKTDVPQRELQPPAEPQSEHKP